MFFCLFAFLVPFQLASQEAGISDLASVAGKAMTQKRHQAYLVSAQAQLKGPIWTNVPLKLQESAHRCSVSLGHWTKGAEVFLSVGGCQLSLALWGGSPWQLLSISLPHGSAAGVRGAPDAVPIPALWLISASVFRKAEAGPAQFEFTMHILKHIRSPADVFIQRQISFHLLWRNKEWQFKANSEWGPSSKHLVHPFHVF